MEYGFPKRERLYGLKTVEKLYTEGDAFVAFPFRIVCLNNDEIGETEPVRVMVSVAKKRYKHAVDRNRIKRLIREAYRLNKAMICDFAADNELHLHLAFQYISNEIMPFDEMDARMKKALNKLMNKYTVRPKNSDETDT